jgi:hypothetical protein
VTAKEAVVVNVGGRPVEWHKRIVRDNRTGKLVEIDVHELGPKVRAEEGVPYAFRRGEEVSSDHPAVSACPSAFEPIEE